MLAAVALAALISDGPSPLERCRAEAKALNTTRTIATCTTAGDDVTASTADRVDALRVLGVALMVEGAADLAEDAFIKMLTLDPDATLGDDAGPSAQHVLAQARTKVQARAAVAPETPRPGPPTTPAPVAAAAPAATTTATAGYVVAGAGGALALASTIVGGAAVYDLYFHRVPCGAGSCVPFAPMLLGLYPAAQRRQFFADGPAWTAAAAVGLAVGVAAAGFGVVLIADGP